jgi:hypothetical protein
MVGVVFFFIVVAVFVGAIANGDKECRESGGKSVSGLFWIECVDT